MTRRVVPAGRQALLFDRFQPDTPKKINRLGTGNEGVKTDHGFFGGPLIYHGINSFKKDLVGLDRFTLDSLFFFKTGESLRGQLEILPKKIRILRKQKNRLL